MRNQTLAASPRAAEIFENKQLQQLLGWKHIWHGACDSKGATCAEVFVVEPTLMVIGLNHRTARLAMRERFWIGENRRYEVLRKLKDAEGVEEALVLSTRCRTEFLVWASEPTLAANSLLQYLTNEHGLKLSEWEHF